MAYQTPGVYLEEKSLFPPSVAAVATAVPAFVGYTQRNTRSNGESLNNIPIRLTSLLEFQQLYGGAYVPATRQAVVDTALAIQAVPYLDGSGNPRRYFLYPAIRHYFYNRSEARPCGKECDRTCKSWCLPYLIKQRKYHKHSI